MEIRGRAGSAGTADPSAQPDASKRVARIPVYRSAALPGLAANRRRMSAPQGDVSLLACREPIPRFSRPRGGVRPRSAYPHSPPRPDEPRPVTNSEPRSGVGC